MSLHFFFVPAVRPEPVQNELNAMLARDRVLTISRDFVADGANSGWAICVEIAPGPGELPDSLRAASSASRAGRRAESVDYKQVLSAPDFEVYAALRELRKQWAQAEGVPVYAVFSNDQLAQIVTRRVASKSALGEIDGVGPARVERYGDALLSALQARRVHLPARSGSDLA